MSQNHQQLRQSRHNRVRAKVVGSTAKPRCAVFRSNKHFYAQLIDDSSAKTLLGLGEAALGVAAVKAKPLERASLLGQKLAVLAKEKGINKIVFDRGGYRYHGQVKAFAESARQGGLVF